MGIGRAHHRSASVSLLVIDRSASMSIADQYDDRCVDTTPQERLVANSLSEPTRLNLAQTADNRRKRRLLTELDHRYRVAAYLVAGGLERVADTADPADLIRDVRELKTDGPDSERHATRRRPLPRARRFPRRAAGRDHIIFRWRDNRGRQPLAEAAEEARRKGVPICSPSA